MVLFNPNQVAARLAGLAKNTILVAKYLLNVP
jgi:hypothetical protein